MDGVLLVGNYNSDATLLEEGPSSVGRSLVQSNAVAVKEIMSSLQVNLLEDLIGSGVGTQDSSSGLEEEEEEDIGELKWEPCVQHGGFSSVSSVDMDTIWDKMASSSFK